MTRKFITKLFIVVAAAAGAVSLTACDENTKLEDVTIGDIQSSATGALDGFQEFVGSEAFAQGKELAVDAVCALGGTYALLDEPKREMADGLIQSFAEEYQGTGGEAGALAESLSSLVEQGSDISTEALESALSRCD